MRLKIGECHKRAGKTLRNTRIQVRENFTVGAPRGEKEIKKRGAANRGRRQH